MQELVRRLVDLCERHRIRLKLTHTPGAKLDRPDQTSRGDPVEDATRQRLAAGRFGEIARRWGSFTGLMGPERSHGPPVGQQGGGDEETGAMERYWAHPTHNTVGSALRMIGERARNAMEQGRRIRAVALVPARSADTYLP